MRALLHGPTLMNVILMRVLFIRSLHHIHPLDESIRHAATGLVEGGLIIVEDFAYETTDEKTLFWFSSAIRLIKATGMLVVSDEFQHKVLSKTETLKAWRQSHEEELHTAAEIGAHLKNVSRRVSRENAAYYFRYIASAITAVEKRDEILQAFAEQGVIRAGDGSINVLGRRVVAMPGG